MDVHSFCWKYNTSLQQIFLLINTVRPRTTEIRACYWWNSCASNQLVPHYLPSSVCFISLLRPVVLHRGGVLLLWLDDWDLPKQQERSRETEMARTENLLGGSLAFTNENAPALWIRFYLLASSHMQSKQHTLGATATLQGWVQPGVGEDYCSHGQGTSQQWTAGGVMPDAPNRSSDFEQSP